RLRLPLPPRRRLPRRPPPQADRQAQPPPLQRGRPPRQLDHPRLTPAAPSRSPPGLTGLTGLPGLASSPARYGGNPDRRAEARVKVFLSSDMEGTAGVVDWEQCVGDGPQAATGRELLLAEVNAAIAGALAGGATEIVVNDSHSTMRNLPPAALAGPASSIPCRFKPLNRRHDPDASDGA